MKKITLYRLPETPDGMFGILCDEGIPFCLTVERKWLNNQRMVSCIPEGIYISKRVQSPKFGDTFEVINVPGRSRILFHKGNIEDDSHGCIVVGEQYESLRNKTAVIASGKAMVEFLARTHGLDEFELAIRRVV